MKKQNHSKIFKVTLVSPDNRYGWQLVTLVQTYTEDKAMDIALRKYEGLEVYEVEEMPNR